MAINTFTTTLLILTVLLVLFPSETYAFGAGDIPDFAYLNGKAFRHGDIENILAEIAKTVGHAGGGGGLLGFAQSMLHAASGGEGATFTKEDVKRVYFGNWLRDYSQAMDIAGLSKLSADTLVLIVSVLGFLTFGFATEEFEVTADRLGVYLPVEHIDNPKGYAEKEGDARQFHPKLRPPVNPEELEIDERTGMKNYMASENRGWDTSTALIRRTFRACIAHGRRAQGREGADLWEAYRLLGTGLHTMEDLLAHSNWCELTLRKMGYNDVFCHVGDDVLIDTPNGQTHPLVTGTFGSADFLHSLMGEATDHLSQASVVDLSKKMDDAAQGENSFGNLQAILEKLPIGGGSNSDEKMNQAGSMQAKAKAYDFDPNNVAPPEVREQLWQLLKWRDDIYRDIIEKIEMVPGLSDLIDNLTNVLNAFVYTVLAPYVTPILEQVTEVLTEGSKAVIDTEDQYEVFDDPSASDPSHSLLSKDHFALILNEPAGKIALAVVQYSVKLIVHAWFDDSNPDRVIDQILEAFHHPWYATGRSRIQAEMFQTMQSWVNDLENQEETIQALTKESVRAGKNKRQGADDDMSNSDQIYGGCRTNQTSGGGQYGASGGYSQSQSQNYGSSGYGQAGTQKYGESEQSYVSTYGGNESRRQNYGKSEEHRYESSGGSGGHVSENRRQEEPSYGRDSEYGGQSEAYQGRRSERVEYGRDTSYGDQSSYGREAGYDNGQSYGRTTADNEPPSYRRESAYNDQPPYSRDDNSYGRSNQTYGEESGYEQRRQRPSGDSESYGGGRRDRDEDLYGSRAQYGEEERPRHHHQQESRREQYAYGSQEGGGGGSGYGREERSEFGEQQSSGYVPSYGASYVSSDYSSRREEGGDQYVGYDRQESRSGGDGETFGVESLSLGEEGRRHHSKHHHREEEY